MPFFYQVTMHAWFSTRGKPSWIDDATPCFKTRTIQTDEELTVETGSRIATTLVHGERLMSSDSVKFGRVVFLELQNGDGHQTGTKTFTAIPGNYWYDDIQDKAIYGFRKANVLRGAWEARCYIDREEGKPRSLRYLCTLSADDLSPAYREHKKPQSFTLNPDGVFGRFCLPLARQVDAMVPQLIDWLDVNRFGLVERISPTIGEANLAFASRFYDWEMAINYRKPERIYWDTYTQYLDELICRSMVEFDKRMSEKIWYTYPPGMEFLANFAGGFASGRHEIKTLMWLFGLTSDEIQPLLGEIAQTDVQGFDEIEFGCLADLDNQEFVLGCCQTLYTLNRAWETVPLNSQGWLGFEFQKETAFAAATTTKQQSDFNRENWYEIMGMLWSIFNVLNLLTQIVVPKVRRQKLLNAPISPRTRPHAVPNAPKSYPQVTEVMPYILLMPPAQPPALTNPAYNP